MACADKARPSEPTGWVNCTDALVADACHGILPCSPHCPPVKPKSGSLNLTLLHSAAKAKGAVCLDGSPAGYVSRTLVSPGHLAPRLALAQTRGAREVHPSTRISGRRTAPFSTFPYS